MICVYDGRDQARTGHGLGVIHPSECAITEETGGSYELSATLPLASEWQLMERGNVIRAPGAPHRMSGQKQDFRIYGVELADDGKSIRVRARHVFYDGATAFVLRNIAADAEAVAVVLDDMVAASSSVPYALDVQVGDATYTGGIDLVNWVNALLDPDAGIVAQSRLRLERDGLTVRLRPEGGEECGLTVRWGVNMTGLTRSETIDQVVTRLQPVGEDAEGNPVFLPETYIDSPRIGDYWQPLRSVWRVAGAKVGQKKRDADGNTVELTLEDVHDMLRKAALERLQSGCDLPEEKTSLAYVDMSRIGPDGAEWVAVHVCLYDWATIVHGAAGIRERVQVTGYTWDVLRQKYTTLEVGDAFRDRTDNAIVTAPQLRKESGAAGRRSLRVEDLINIEADQIRMQAREIELIAYDVKDLDRRTSSAEVRLDGMDGQVTLLGTKVYDQGDTINQVIADLNAAEAAILLKASQVMLDDLNSQVSEASIVLNALKASVNLKAEQAIVDEHGQRLFAAEIGLSAAEQNILLLTGEVDAQGELISGVSLDLDGQAGRITALADEILLKADKIDLQGFVTAAQLAASYAKITDLDAIQAQITNLTGGLVTASVLRSTLFTGNQANFTFLTSDAFNLGNELVQKRSISMGDVTSAGRALAIGDLTLDHSHEVTVSSDGKLKMGKATGEGSTFDLAATQFYKDGVAAATTKGAESLVFYAGGKEDVANLDYGKSLSITATTTRADGTALAKGILVKAPPDNYNTGWNECIQNANAFACLINYYAAGETLYDRDGNVAAGPWYKGTPATRYSLPASK